MGDANTKSLYKVSDLVQTIYSDAFALTESETLVLRLYDQLRDLELQLSLLRAQETAQVADVSSILDGDLQEQLIIAERDAMEAKAEYELRNRITHNVLVTDPVLKAVHGGDDTEYFERHLLPLITENDTIVMVQGHLASRLTSATRDLVTAEQANMVANQKNRDLSKTLLVLAEATKEQSAENIGDPKLRNQIKLLDKEWQESRRRLKTLKGILSAMIVGSGINWAADESLTELVLDDEDD